MPMNPLAIVGPTGVGKTAVAVEVCRRAGGEIVSIDSRQVFRGLEICSNAPTPGELRGVRCHLVGCLEVGERIDAQRYVRMARPVVDALVLEGRQTVLTAGTGLYLKALLEGLDLGGHPADPALRAQLETQAVLDLSGLFRRLSALDPGAASRVDAANPGRVVRATELALRRQRGDVPAPATATPLAAIKVGLTAPRAQLYEWIEARADRLLAKGWSGEIEALLDSGADLSRSAFSSIGAREMVAFVRGEMLLAALREAIVRRTRNYAKRQLTWYRADREVRWLDVTRYSGSDIVDAILELLEQR
jgi:tRNA dimethylallyltransferase